MKSLNPLAVILLLFIICLGLYFGQSKFSEMVENNQFSMKFTTQQELYPTWREQLKSKQTQTASDYQIFMEFKFHNQIKKSQIDFKHKVNPYGTKEHTAIHYDHGNGMSISDVNNDGHYDILFVSQVGASELWKNNGDGTFQNITKESGLEITTNKPCVSAAFADIDNDGDPDLYVTTLRKGNFLFENMGDGKFKDISEIAGVNYHGHCSGVCFFDFNNDSLLDIFVANVGVYTTDNERTFELDGKTYKFFGGVDDAFAGHLKPQRSEKSVLYKNLGENRFKEVSKELDLVDDSWIGDAVILDANDDGFQDLYMINMQGNDQYFENVDGKKFIKKSRELFPKTSWGAMGIDVFDFDNDGMQDIYVVDMHSDMGDNATLTVEKEKGKFNVFPEAYLMTKGANIAGNTFFKKTGKNKYKEISDDINAENYWPWGISTGDLNADGYEDVFVSKSMNYPFRYTENGVLLNAQGKRFLDSEYILGVEPRLNGAYAKPWFDLDCSGTDKEHKHCLDKEGKLSVWGSLGTRSSVIFDMDHDGDLDIVTNEFNDAPMVLVSNLSEKRKINFLSIDLQGTRTNRDGLGATVVVKTPTGTYTKVNDGKSGYLSQSSMPIYFGLDDQNTIESIEVHWPSGIVQKLENIESNQELLITEKG